MRIPGQQSQHWHNIVTNTRNSPMLWSGSEQVTPPPHTHTRTSVPNAEFIWSRLLFPTDATFTTKLQWEALLQNLDYNNVTRVFLLNPEAPVQSYKRYVGFGVDFRGLCKVRPYSSFRPGIPATSNTKSYIICHVKSQIILHNVRVTKPVHSGSLHSKQNENILQENTQVLSLVLFIRISA